MERVLELDDVRETRSYRDIKKIVIDRIQDRIWEPNSLLPTEVDLAKEFSTTRTTVNRALRELADEGILERKRKQGTRVLGAPMRQARFSIPLVREEILKTGAEYRYSLIRKETLDCPDWLASRLNCDRSAKVLHVLCLHYANTAPYQLEDRWLLTDTVPTVVDQDFETTSPNEWLVQKIPFTNVEITFSASRADQALADFLACSNGDPIFTVERTTWLKAQPVTFARLYFAAGYRMTSRI